MRILIIHRGFPGQFKHLVEKLKSLSNQVWAIVPKQSKNRIPEGVSYVLYKPSQGNGKDTFTLASEIETKIIRGEAVARAAYSLAQKGFKPDLIIGHPGWGEMLFLADIWKDIPQIHYVEFFHGVPNTDNDITDAYATPQTWIERARAKVKNTNLLSNLEQMSAGLTPTLFQYSLLPEWAKQKTSIIHDGIDTNWLHPDSSAELQIPEGPLLKYGDPIITFINRTFEPYRGIHTFMETVAKVQSLLPNVDVVLIGKDSPIVSYGASRKDGQGWLSALRNEHGSKLNWNRIHTLGHVAHSTLKTVYQISSAHVYLSYPFVLSWSLLEAMSCEALVIGNNTAPVREVIKPNINGLLVPFGDSQSLCNALIHALKRPELYRNIRQNARQHVKINYDLSSCLDQQLKLMKSVELGA